MSTTFQRDGLASDDATSGPGLGIQIKNKRSKAWSHGLIPDDTCDLVDIWLSSPGLFKVLGKYLKPKDDAFFSIYHLRAMDFEHGARAFFQMLPIALLLLVGGMMMSVHLSTFYILFKMVYAAVCFFVVNCMFALAAHSILDLGDAMDKEGVWKTRTDTDLMGTLAFLGLLLTESLVQLPIFTILGGFLALFASLTGTLIVLGIATLMNHYKVAFTISDQRVLNETAQAEEQRRIDEKDRRIIKAESTIEYLRFQVGAKQQKIQRREDTIKKHETRIKDQENRTTVHKNALQFARMYAFRKAQQIKDLKTALTDAQTGAENVSTANDWLQATLAKASKSHDEALATQKKHYVEELDKERAHAHNMMKAYHARLSEKYTEQCSELKQRYIASLNEKDKEHAEALAANEEQQQDVLMKEKAEAWSHGSKQALKICEQAYKSKLEAEKQKHTECLAVAVEKQEKLHWEILATKEKQQQDELIKEKFDAKAAGWAEADVWCRKAHQSQLKAAERRHAEILAAREELHKEMLADAVLEHEEALAEAVAERGKLHEETLATKDQDFDASLQQLAEEQARVHLVVLRLSEEFVDGVREEYGREIGVKDQELASLKELMARHPEVWFAEEEEEGEEEEGPVQESQDEGYVSVPDRESLNESESEDGGTEEGEAPKKDDVKGFIDTIIAALQKTDTCPEYDADDEDQENQDLYQIEYKERSLELNFDGDSDDEFREWGLVDSDDEGN